MAPVYLGAGWVLGVPGAGFHARIAGTALKLAALGRLPVREAFGIVMSPLDSVRYFEFPFAWAAARSAPPGGRYLDVSSPRLFPLALLSSRRDLEATLINPDGRDLELTRRLAEAWSVRAHLVRASIEDATFAPASFDLVTSLSVVEHIPAPGDRDAVQRMWELVRPGGRLLLTVPCAREAAEEHVDWNEYGLLTVGEDGFVFGQRLYDERMLAEVFFAQLGRPRRMEVYGERQQGLFLADRARKLQGMHAGEREPLNTARWYRRYPSIESLPGWGVVGLEFVKPDRA